MKIKQKKRGSKEISSFYYLYSEYSENGLQKGLTPLHCIPQAVCQKHRRILGKVGLSCICVECIRLFRWCLGTDFPLRRIEVSY